MSRVSMSDACHTCKHTYSTHETKNHLVVCSCRQFVAAPDLEDKTLSTLENIEEQLRRLNATMERFEPFLAGNRAKSAPVNPQEAQEPREDLKPVVREGDEEFSALAASMYEGLIALLPELAYDGTKWGKAWNVLAKYRTRYEDYKAQQRDHDDADREDAER